MDISASIDGFKTEGSGSIVLAAGDHSVSIEIDDIRIRLDLTSGLGDAAAFVSSPDPKNITIRFIDLPEKITYSVDDIAVVSGRSLSLNVFISQVTGKLGSTWFVAYSVLSK